MTKVGEQAPSFNLLDQDQNRIVLSKEIAKSKVLLVFYPGADTPVCTSQLADYKANYETFKKLGIEILAITLATNEKSAAFAKKLEVPFKLLADYDFRVTKYYGMASIGGVPKRALFLVDENQKVIYKHVETLPITFRNSETLLPELKKIAPPPAPAPAETPQPEAQA